MTDVDELAKSRISDGSAMSSLANNTISNARGDTGTQLGSHHDEKL
jgi:hypothetical protein